MKKILFFLLLLGFIQNSNAVIKVRNSQVRKKLPVYLGKKDPIFLALKARAWTDLKMATERGNPATEENQKKKATMNLWPQEKQDSCNDFFLESLREYTEQINFDFSTFLMVFSDFKSMELRKFVEEYDFRVRRLDGNKYAAEYWEDLLVANSEANALLWAQQISKRYPDNKNVVAEVKKTYANARKLIISGKQKRYTQVMGLLYTKEKDGSIRFHDPGQVMHDVDFK